MKETTELSLKGREIAGKKVAGLRSQGLVVGVVYGKGFPATKVQSEYLPTERALEAVGYHSPIALEIDGKKQLAMVKNVEIDAVTQKIMNVEFHAISADDVVVAETPIVVTGFEQSEANKIHLTLLQVLENIEIKAKPSDLPENLEVDGSQMADITSELTVGDINLPKGVKFADAEIEMAQVVATVYDAAADAAAQEAADKAADAAAANASAVPAAETPAETPKE
ncbi:MAG: 50S ribosomal protein L25 [Candidatus Nomurabacteria bacterium]|jgi:large subunit ribosomal protein L25|nr:50S ribosomal protein L25 [Candidatus Nomurabacteria bacterium]